MQLSKLNTEAIQKIKHLIESSICQRFSMKDLSSHSKLGETKLALSFKFFYQITIAQYHLTISMEYAKALLEEGNQVKEVALRLGYKTNGHFSRAFLKVFNQLPGTFKLRG